MHAARTGAGPGSGKAEAGRRIPHFTEVHYRMWAGFAGRSAGSTRGAWSATPELIVTVDEPELVAEAVNRIAGR
ncbi:hypothetical protein AB0F91_31460 [Amycolatopsis sp. NPDC023774]|uniref:hypothetical protein n=1 Tax=Amycolatopsis sp. NPDC023774 TaxID=3155015 RepID=UPI0033FA8B8D